LVDCFSCYYARVNVG